MARPQDHNLFVNEASSKVLIRPVQGISSFPSCHSAIPIVIGSRYRDPNFALNKRLRSSFGMLVIPKIVSTVVLKAFQ